MSNRIDIRRWERPDRPQPVYKGVLSLWEAPLYAAIAAAALNCSGLASPRLGDRVYLQQTAPQPAWIFVNLPAVSPPTVAQTTPAMAQASAGFRSTAEPGLDVRLHVSETNFGVPDDATVAQQAAIWSQTANPGRTTLEAPLDVRTHSWQPPPSWFFPSLPVDSTVAQRAAAWAQTANPGRTPDRGGDVRRIQTEPAFSWAWKVADGILATWLPAFDALQASVRTPDRANLESRHTWQPPLGWVVTNFAPDATVGQQAAIWAQQVNAQYGRTRERGGDVRRIQTEPAFTWAAKVVDGIVALWAPVFDAQASPRTIARRLLDVRAVSDLPEIAWWSPTLPVATVSESLRVLIGPTHLRSLRGPTHNRNLIA